MKVTLRITSVVGLLIVVGLLAACGGEQPAPQAPTSSEGTPAATGAEGRQVAQASCPVMDLPINKEIFVDYEGKRVYFCCPACPSKFNADPERYLSKLEQMGVVLEDAPAGGSAPTMDMGEHAGHEEAGEAAEGAGHDEHAGHEENGERAE